MMLVKIRTSDDGVNWSRWETLNWPEVQTYDGSRFLQVATIQDNIIEFSPMFGRDQEMVGPQR